MKFKKGDYVKVKKILFSDRFVSLGKRTSSPPKRLLNCTGKIVDFWYSENIPKVRVSPYGLCMVRFLYYVNYDEGYKQVEQFLFYPQELRKAGKQEIKRYKKWEDMLEAKEMAERI